MTKILNRITEKWYLSALFYSIFPLWFTIVNLFGTQWKLKDKSGNLTFLTSIVCWVLIVVLITLYILKAIIDKRNISGSDILKVVNSSNLVIDKSNLSSVEKIIKCKTFNFKTSFYALANSNLKELLKELIICISKATGLERESIAISIISKNLKNEWVYAEKINLDGAMKIDKLMNNPCSTVSKLIESKQEYLFYSNKNKAIADCCYIPGSKDSANNNQGSIFCKDLSIEFDNNSRLDMYLSITTYESKLCDTESLNKLLKLIISPFEKKIQYDMCLRYIRYKANSLKERASVDTEKVVG